ncbi:hypothetical protein QM012_003547 [Aureobasidium pullulans]|uniref:PA14 domain-containing protein n=1 Tax=Aureobasidium pullulans TaxID=5580 RepID=A0ABR0T932_AURPU
MKASLLASGLVLGTFASSAIANPLEARALGTRTVTTTATTTQTNTITKYKTTTHTQTQTVTETETEIIKKTKTKTVVSSTTITVPTTVTKVSTHNVPGPTTTKTVVSSTTLVVNRPTTTTAYKTLTSISTISLPAQTILSTKTLLPSTVTVLKTLPVSVSTKTLPASTLISIQTLPASTLVSTKTVQSVKTSVVSAPAQTLTSFLTTEIPGPTITDLSIATITAVSTAFVNNGNGTCGSPSSWNATIPSTSLPSLDLTSSAISYPTYTSSNMTVAATTSAPAAASSTAVSYANVKTATCDSAPAYYIQVSNSGTAVDGTVFCNQGGPTSSGSWIYMYPPASADTLASLGVGSMIPQPFVYDQQTGDLVSYWNSGESLTSYITGDGRAGLVFSGSYDPPLSCGLEGSTLVNCGSNYTGSFQMGVRVEGSGDYLYSLRVFGGDNYDSDYDHDATFTLIPACDLNDAEGSSMSTSTPAAASTTSPSAAATSTAASYPNVITTTCENPKAYYIEMTNSGTPADGTVMCNGYAGTTDNWMYFDPPSSAAVLGQQLPQPFNFDNSTGMLTTTWSTGESLAVYPIQNVDTRSGYVYSVVDGPSLICSMDGDQLVDCHSSQTPSVLGLRFEAESGMLRVAGGYSYDNAKDATFRMIPACDV